MSAPPPSKLDFPQVLQGAFDDNTGTLRTSTTAIISPTGSVNILIASSADSVALGSSDGSLTATFTALTGKTGLDVNIINQVPVQAVSGNALTATIAGTANVNVTDQLAISSIVPVGISGTTAVSGSALTATVANQLAISSIVPVSVSGTTAVSGSALTAFLANVQGSVTGDGAAVSSLMIGGQYNSSFPALTAGQQAAIQLDSSARQIISPLTNSSVVKAQLQDNSGSAITLGQKAMSSSVPVVIASDQNALAISGSALTTFIAGTANVNVTDQLAVSSIVPVSITGTAAVSSAALTTVLTSPAHQVGSLISPYGYLRTTGEGSALLYDDFDSTLDPNQWTTAITGTAATSLTTSFLVLSTGTTSGNTVSVQSIPTFPRGRWGFVQVGIGILFDSGNVTNVDRFWGLGNLTDGIGFELINNTLRAVVYQAGSLIFSSVLTKPNDGKTHSYIIVSRVDQTYWFMDGFDAPIASASYLNPNVNTLSVNLFMTNTGIPGSAPIFQIMSVGIQTTDDSTSSISDGVYPWLQAKVTTALNLRVDGSTVNQPIRASTGIFTDFSGTASTASTQFVAANTNRKYLLIANQSLSIPIAVNFGTSASMNGAGSFQIGPKSSFILDNTWLTTQSVNIVAPAGTPPVTVKEGT